MAPQELRERVEAIARELNTTKSDVVRRCVYRALPELWKIDVAAKRKQERSLKEAVTETITQ
jgi:hypothetical protein